MTNEEINSMKNALDDGIKKQKTELIKKFEKPALRTPTCALVVRGTTFSVSQDSINGTTLIVTDGAVDLTGLKMGYTFTVEAGFKGIVKSTGEISGPVKLEEEDLVRWWED